MSLKAKLEAVIYAAEEPVTLAQLAALFAEDALGWKAEQAAALAAAAEPEPAGESLPLQNEAFDYLELAQAAEAMEREPEAVPTEPVTPEPVEGAAADETAASEPEAAASDAEPETAPVDTEAEAKRLARQRDREVKAVLRQLLDELIATYANDDRGIEIKEIAGGYRMATKPECHDAARMFVKSLKPALKLSLPALETLAVIAYKQPVTAPEVNEIRGVDSSGVFGSLLARKLVATAGRKQVIGRPILYKTTKEFLLRFGLKDVNELPSMEEFEKMAQLEFDEADMAGGGEAPLPENADGLPEVDEEPDAPLEEAIAAAELAAEEEAQQEVESDQQTAVTADSEANPAGLVPSSPEPESPEQPAGAPADEAASTPAEAAPAAPSTLEQAETENVSHD
jgi:segregation and condensation protein B